MYMLVNKLVKATEAVASGGFSAGRVRGAVLLEMGWMPPGCLDAGTHSKHTVYILFLINNNSKAF